MKKHHVILDLQLGESEFVIAYYFDDEHVEENAYYTDSHGDAIRTQIAMKREAEEQGHSVELTYTMREHDTEE